MSIPNTNLLLGPAQIGYTVATFMFGLTTVQSYLYYQDFSDDPRVLRILVAFLWLVDFTHQICCSHLVYFVTITLHGDTDFFDDRRLPKSLDAVTLLTTITEISVLAFYNYRIWAARKQRIVATIVSVLLFGRFLSSLVLYGFAAKMATLVDYFVQYRWLITTLWVVGAVEDIIMTLALCQDWHAHRRLELYRTSRFVDRLIIWVVGTGMLSSTVAVALSITFALMGSQNLVWVAFFFPMPRFFSNSFLVTLNARSSLQSVEQSKAINRESQFRVALSQPCALSVEVVVVTETDREAKELQMKQNV